MPFCLIPLIATKDPLIILSILLSNLAQKQAPSSATIELYHTIIESFL